MMNTGRPASPREVRDCRTTGDRLQGRASNIEHCRAALARRKRKKIDTMQVTETLAEGLKHEFKVSVPASDLDAKADAKLVDLKDKVKLNGFRPGKVPVSHLKKVYGRSVMAEAIDQTIRDTNTQIFTDRGFRLATEPKITMPTEQSEVEELLYGEDRPASERLARLRELRDESAIRESGDWGDQDPAAMLDELDRAIDELSATIANGDEAEDYAGLATNFDNDPADRLDALSPDDEEARQAIEGDEDAFFEEDEGDGIGPLDETEWDEGDDFRPEKGVH
jgi:hypothetical protein